MKQVTGKTNSNTTVDKVSIRLALDGHSFSISGEEKQEVKSEVTVEVLTPRTLLVPAELLNQTSDVEKEMADLLVMAGLAMKSGDCVICSHENNGVAAIMAVPQDAISRIQNRFKRKVRYTTPLLDLTAEGTALRIHRVADLLYIKVYSENCLRLAEVVPIVGESDLLYLFERIDAEFPLKTYRAIISGDNPKRLHKLLGRRFKEVVCE